MEDNIYIKGQLPLKAIGWLQTTPIQNNKQGSAAWPVNKKTIGFVCELINRNHKKQISIPSNDTSTFDRVPIAIALDYIQYQYTKKWFSQPTSSTVKHDHTGTLAVGALLDIIFAFKTKDASRSSALNIVKQVVERRNSVDIEADYDEFIDLFKRDMVFQKSFLNDR